MLTIWMNDTNTVTYILYYTWLKYCVFMLKFTNVAHETAQLDIQHFALIVFFIRLQILNFYINSVNRKPSKFHSLNDIIRYFHNFFPQIFLTLRKQKTNFLLVPNPYWFFFLSLPVEKEILINNLLKKFVHLEFEIGETI